jgi:uncharacterized membrane protein
MTMRMASPLWIAALLAAILGALLTAAVFGFFYAYASSVMFGFDSLSEQNAVIAMQGVNATVRNRYFAPAFFGPTPVLLLAAGLAYLATARRAALAFTAAAAVYLFAAFLPTMLVNVPMNDALARVSAQSSDIAAVWAEYSPRWQWWNLARTVASGVSVLLALFGLVSLGASARTTARVPASMGRLEAARVAS